MKKKVRGIVSRKLVLIFLIVTIATGFQFKCKKKSSLEAQIYSAIELLQKKYKYLLVENSKTGLIPGGCNNAGDIELVEARNWTSGFFPGTLWYLFEHSKDDFWLENAEKYTNQLENMQFNTGTHDLGFMMFCSYGNALRLTDDETYKPILLQSAKSLASRYNDNVGTIKSWDFRGWWKQYPVIIDNMMNLELLMWASRQIPDNNFETIAKSHADKTIENHFFDDYSCCHVVDYDTITGKALKSGTFQGYSDSSSWARGQAWGLYGFTMMYRETKEKKYLDQAENIAAYIIKKLKGDFVPVWDFEVPDPEKEPKDASAGAIISSALFELSGYSEKNKVNYIRVAEKILYSLSSDKYLDRNAEGCGFVVKHSVVSKPHDKGVDVHLSYADYYFLEASLRYLNLQPVDEK